MVWFISDLDKATWADDKSPPDHVEQAGSVFIICDEQGINRISGSDGAIFFTGEDHGEQVLERLKNEYQAA